MELWAKQDDTALNSQYRDFIAHDGAAPVEDYFMGTVTMTVREHLALLRESKRNRRFAIGATIMAAVLAVAVAGLIVGSL